MLARGAHRILTHSPRHSLSLLRSGSRPSDRRHFIQGLCNEFLDVAIALPLPPSLPAYSTTIVLVTVITRLGFLPLAIWVCIHIYPHLSIIDSFCARRRNADNGGSKKKSFLKSKS